MIQFGIEMEGYGLTKEQIEEVMERCGAEHKGFFGWHEGGTNCSKQDNGRFIWKTESDSSLNQAFCGYGRAGSHEIISPIMYGKSGQLHVEKVWRELKKEGFQVDSKCGTHITMGINHNARYNRMSNAKKMEVGMRVAQIYAHFQDVFDALSPNIRNGGYHYCSKPNLNSPFGTRTSAVNLTKWAMYGCVEFRQFGYTTDIKNFRGWMKVLDSILACAFNENHRSYGADLSQIPVTWDAMAEFLNIGAKATRWGDDRISHLLATYQNGRENRAAVLSFPSNFGGEQ